MILRGEFLALSHSQKNQVMKSIKTSGIILGMTMTIGGLLFLVRPTLAVSPTQQQETVSTLENELQNLYQQGLSKIAFGDYQGALSDLDRVILLNPEYVEAYCNRGIIRAQLGNSEESLKDLQQAAQLFWDSGNIGAYQETLTYIQMIQSQLI